eukprot:s8239_g1.t1
MELMGPRLPPFEWTGRKSPFGGIDGVDGIDGASPSLLSNGRSRKVRSAELMELMELMGGSRPASFRVSPSFIPGVVRFHSGSRPVWHPHKKTLNLIKKRLFGPPPILNSSKNVSGGSRRRGRSGPPPMQRGFQPQYGAVRDVESYDAMTVRATDGSETLLKHALPVPRGSAEPKARLTRRPVPSAVRQLRDFNPGPTAPP